MTWWDIKPQGVQGQLQLTGTKAGELEKALKAMLKDIQAAAEAAGTAVPGSAATTRLQGPPSSSDDLVRKAQGPVAAALGEYVQKRGKEFSSMAERTQAAVLGAAKATNAYLEGDLKAAKEAQDAARSVRLDLLKDAGGKK
ncbi:hypothetical protein I3F58_07085 [Streptomyces sp. MUM 203J]|uniref:DUF6507 family protein n=1 Tax=Streptomyces sp. MUM 203J TaxID=2791990 RepID=UPI001F03F523|nr:DUF6507 family protein [Streptomyces sp. MUM 203J]MCH0539328.1 hypothetical protein [Streptomyces sp. MUM 203J]